jgi:hypothetical protein
MPVITQLLYMKMITASHSSQDTQQMAFSTLAILQFDSVTIQLSITAE